MEVFEELESTNDLLLEKAKGDTVAAPSLVWAMRQTRGRGRSGAAWFTTEGSIAISLLLEAPTQLNHGELASVLAISTGVATCETLTRLFPLGVFALKWPNDVFLNGKKTAGILVERPSVQSPVVVVGVGVNLNNSLVDAPDEVRGRAISLVDAAGVRFEESEVVAELAVAIADRVKDAAADFTIVLNAFRLRCLLTGKLVEISQANRTIAGRCGGVDSTGGLRIHTSNGPEMVTQGTVTKFEVG